MHSEHIISLGRWIPEVNMHFNRISLLAALGFHCELRETEFTSVRKNNFSQCHGSAGEPVPGVSWVPTLVGPR